MSLKDSYNQYVEDLEKKKGIIIPSDEWQNMIPDFITSTRNKVDFSHENKKQVGDFISLLNNEIWESFYSEKPPKASYSLEGFGNFITASDSFLWFVQIKLPDNSIRMATIRINTSDLVPYKYKKNPTKRDSYAKYDKSGSKVGFFNKSRESAGRDIASLAQAAVDRTVSDYKSRLSTIIDREQEYVVIEYFHEYKEYQGTYIKYIIMFRDGNVYLFNVGVSTKYLNYESPLSLDKASCEEFLYKKLIEFNRNNKCDVIR